MVPSALARDAAWLKIATGMASAMAGEQQLQQLVETICEVMPCDAVALLRRVDQRLVPVAVHGLAPEIIGQQFDPLAQPRLAAILAAAQPVRFAAPLMAGWPRIVNAIAMSTPVSAAACRLRGSWWGC